MKSLLRDNGLPIALLALFLFSVLGMIWSGHAAYNEELQEHGFATVGLLAYMTSGEFLSALFENWESEFLQMSAYVILTAMLSSAGPLSRETRTTPIARTMNHRRLCARAARCLFGFIPTHLGSRWRCCSSCRLHCIGGEA